ncbi:MAG TPA: hypothetical protein VF773_15045 [Verrucomicrobiae bacterium]
MLLRPSAYLNFFIILSALLIPTSNADALRELWSADLRDSGSRFRIFDPNGDIIKISLGPTSATHFIEKLDGKTGASKWKQVANYNLPGFTSLNTDHRGNLLIGTGTSTNLNASQAVARKISGQTGHLLWERAWTNAPYIPYIFSDTNGNIAVQLGLTIAKVSSDGTELWQKHLGPVTTPAVIGIAENGDVGRISHLDKTIRVVKFRAHDGAIILDRESTVTNEIAYFNDLAVANDGSIAFTATGFPPGGPTMFSGKVSADGDHSWIHWYFNPLVHSDGRSLLCLADGDVVAIGRGGPHIPVVRYDSTTGRIKWDTVIAPPPDPLNYSEHTQGISVTPAGHVLLSTFRNDGLVTIYELDSADGRIRWSVPVDFYYLTIDVLHASRSLAIIGTTKPHSFEQPETFTTLRHFTFGPELTTRPFPNHLEISWEPENLGSTLQHSTNNSAPFNWQAVEGSTTTNLLRLPKTEAAAVFRLVRQ